MPVRVLLIAVFLSVPPVITSAEPPPSYLDKPVFFELVSHEHADPANLELLPSGSVRLAPIGTEAVADFDWVEHTRTDKSWWQRMEGWTYMLPFLDAEDSAAYDFTRQWFMSWYAAHKDDFEPNTGADDAMSVGLRALVFVRLLKIAEQQDPPDEALAKKIRATLATHQAFLRDPEHFSDNSNHGMWESLGLFETTRVLPDDATTQLALDRLLQIADLSVSDMGAHREHAAAYHFYFLEWLAQYVAYFESLAPYKPPIVASLASDESKMRSAAYFLYDHELELPQIGDTDAGVIVDEAFRSDGAGNEVFFDVQAGYAIFKEDEESVGKRYVVFSNQNDEFPPPLPYHIHNDALAVYFNAGGEVILGDQGRHSYSRNRIRVYVMSVAAHNTIFPLSEIVPTKPGINRVNKTWVEESSKKVVFGATMASGNIERVVEIPAGGAGIRVKDKISASDTQVMLWNIGPDVATIDEGESKSSGDKRTYRWTLTTNKGQIFELRIEVKGQSFSAAKEVRTVKGHPDPYLGWYSAGFEQWEPSTVIVLEFKPIQQMQVMTSVDTPRKSFWDRIFKRN